MSGKGKPLNPQRRLLVPGTIPADVVTTDDAKIHLSDIQVDQANIGDVPTFDGAGWSPKAPSAGGMVPKYQHTAIDLSVDADTTVVGVDSSGGLKPTITLADPATVPHAGWRVLVKDETETASGGSNNIHIITAAGNIESPSTINLDGGWLEYYSDGVSNWFLCGDGTVGAVLI